MELLHAAFKLCTWLVNFADSALEKVKLWSTSVANSCPFSVSSRVDFAMPFNAVAYPAHVELFRFVVFARVASAPMAFCYAVFERKVVRNVV